jgi:hypothetical protein
MTRGIESPGTYYYRRLFTDAVRLVDAARTLDFVDSDESPSRAPARAAPSPSRSPASCPISSL